MTRLALQEGFFFFQEGGKRDKVKGEVLYGQLVTADERRRGDEGEQRKRRGGQGEGALMGLG